MNIRTLYLLIIPIFACNLIYAQKTLLTGKDRALLFAVNNYSQMTALSNPIQNANDIADILEARYGFKVEVIPNPTFEKIEQTLLSYQKNYQNGTYARDGQLLVFFSGHGIKRGNNGYFMPVDADPARPYAKGIEYDFWRSEINNIDCKHILVAIDACHSISFDPNWQSKTDRKFSRPGERFADQVLVNHDNYRARLFFTSDAVGDQTPDRSTFARQLLEGLRTHHTTDGYLTSSQLFANYMQKAAPTPGGGNFGDDEAGSCFLFFPIKQKTSKSSEDYSRRQADIQAYKAIQANPEITSCQQYLDNFPTGAFRAEVNTILAGLQEDVDWEFAALKNTKTAYQAYLRDYPSGKYVNQARLKINGREPTRSNTKNTIPPKQRVDMISGRVTNDKGEAVIGAAIYVLDVLGAGGHKIGTATDIDGSYQLSLPEGARQIKVSGYNGKGYKSKTINVGYEEVVDVVLERKGLNKVLNKN